jgi:hypothetical protein
MPIGPTGIRAMSSAVQSASSPPSRDSTVAAANLGARAATAAGALVPPLVLAIIVLPMLGLRSLWLDEAWVANLILHRVIDPVSLDTTPIGLYTAVAAVVALAGHSEFWLRLVPFLFGAGAAALTYVWGRSLNRSQNAALFLAVLLVANPALISYAKELKPYTADMFFCVLIIVLGLRVRRRGSRLDWAVYAITLICGQLFSFPFLFVAFVCSLILLSQALERGSRKTEDNSTLGHGPCVGRHRRCHRSASPAAIPAFERLGDLLEFWLSAAWIARSCRRVVRQARRPSDQVLLCSILVIGA